VTPGDTLRRCGHEANHVCDLDIRMLKELDLKARAMRKWRESSTASMHVPTSSNDIGLEPGCAVADILDQIVEHCPDVSIIRQHLGEVALERFAEPSCALVFRKVNPLQLLLDTAHCAQLRFETGA
jgi:hypothetical protein